MREEQAYSGLGAALPRGRGGGTLHCSLAIDAVWHRYCLYYLETGLEKGTERPGVAPYRSAERSSALSQRASSIVQDEEQRPRGRHMRHAPPLCTTSVHQDSTFSCRKERNTP
jgi:hypothetical protein